MYKELRDEQHPYIPNNGYLYLGQAGALVAHHGPDCEGPPGNSTRVWVGRLFTDNIISYEIKEREPVIFVLWGQMQGLKEAIDGSRHHIDSPSGPHRGFFRVDICQGKPASEETESKSL